VGGGAMIVAILLIVVLALIALGVDGGDDPSGE
jgi:hypothetical protein